MYGYIDSNRQFVRPDSVGYYDITIIDPTDEQLAELGYLLRVDTEAPAESGYVSYYKEIDGKAVQHWEKDPKKEQPVAPRNIVVGEYITVNEVLYLATENIPNGEPIIVGQNAVKTTIEEQLYELKGE